MYKLHPPKNIDPNYVRKNTKLDTAIDMISNGYSFDTVVEKLNVKDRDLFLKRITERISNTESDKKMSLPRPRVEDIHAMLKQAYDVGLNSNKPDSMVKAAEAIARIYDMYGNTSSPNIHITNIVQNLATLSDNELEQLINSRNSEELAIIDQEPGNKSLPSPDESQDAKRDS